MVMTPVKYHHSLRDSNTLSKVPAVAVRLDGHVPQAQTLHIPVLGSLSHFHRESPDVLLGRSFFSFKMRCRRRTDPQHGCLALRCVGVEDEVVEILCRGCGGVRRCQGVDDWDWLVD